MKSKMKSYLIFIWLAVFGCLFGSNVFAETAEEKGLAIALEADKRDTGWGDQQARLEMILKNRYGQESKRNNRNNSIRTNTH